jgi:EAL domain-containing protein (putative c-di-GMP-specific phosphodiesterase class I)
MSAFDRDFTAEGRHVRVGCSAGLSLFSGERLDAETLLGQADTAMHFAKARGGGRLLRFDQEMVERLGDRLTMESSLRESIADEVLQLVYQPKFDIQTNAITGVEALSRWTHPTLGIVAPQHFISVAEDSELICDLGSWVLRESCAQVARWRQDGRRAIPIAMNVSARQLTARLPALLSTCAEERGVEPGLLELEITETMLISSPEASRLVLEQVAGGGTGVVLDDFGVGFSSLTHVKLMHLSGIKVDRSFVIDIATSRHDRAIVTAIVGLAHGLGLRVIAEGIESEAQLRILRDLGCDEAQGFFLSRPLTGDEVAAQFMARLD